LELIVARPRSPRWLAFLMATGAAILVALGVPGPAWAVDVPNAITIAGPGLSSPLALHATLDTDLFTRLLHQVSWMAGAGGATMVPDPATLGPKYQLTVYSGGKPLQVYTLYPEAKGGPKAFRPKDQPQGKGADAWFYVSMSVPELLQAAGVPMSDPDKVGLEYQDPAGYIPAAADTRDHPLLNLKQIVDAQRRTLLVWVGSAIGVLTLVVLAARLSRRRYAS
jgi:hypothetical protein